nr:uncharacterized protein LOC128697213 [Cherax quadricarinatus]XP_053644747.1 uncharacterized protein LOC128697213 [Cherax quadricarinatus]
MSGIGITIGAGGAAAAAAAAIAAAGAVGLGALGVAALSRRRSRSRGHRNTYGGYRNTYGGSRHRRSGRRRHRNRYGRNVEKEPQVELEEALNKIRKTDVTGCGLRLVCDLAATDRLSVEELAILQLIGPTVKPGEGLLPPGASGEYKQAKWYGESGGDCHEAFPDCPYNGTQLMNIVMDYLP